MILVLSIFLIFFNSTYFSYSFDLLLVHVFFESHLSTPTSLASPPFHTKVPLPGTSCHANSFWSFKSLLKTCSVDLQLLLQQDFCICTSCSSTPIIDMCVCVRVRVCIHTLDRSVVLWGTFILALLLVKVLACVSLCDCL